jgi:hypothetical protein
VAATRTDPRDATGAAAEKAAKENAKTLRERADEISLVRAQEEVSLRTEVFDPKNPDVPLVLDEVEELGVTMRDNSVIIRTVVDIEDMTYGVGNNYTFKAGQKYKVDKGLADYLEMLGYVWQPN